MCSFICSVAWRSHRIIKCCIPQSTQLNISVEVASPASDRRGGDVEILWRRESIYQAWCASSCPFVCTTSSSCSSNQAWGAVEWMFVRRLLFLTPPPPPMKPCLSQRQSWIFLLLASSKHFLDMLNLGDFTYTGSGTSVHHHIHSVAWEVCLPCNYSIFSFAHKTDPRDGSFVLVLPSAESSAAAVSDIGLTSLAELCGFFQKQNLLYEFSSKIHYVKTENARKNKSSSHLKKLRGFI